MDDAIYEIVVVTPLDDAMVVDFGRLDEPVDLATRLDEPRPIGLDDFVNDVPEGEDRV